MNPRIVPKRNNFNEPLNGLRGLAVSLVFFHHVLTHSLLLQGFLSEQNKYPLVTFLFDRAQYGVELFFMISGYLITSSLIRHQNVTAFCVNRCLRIYPAFTPLLILVFIVGPIIGYSFFDGIGLMEWVIHFFLNLLFIPGLIESPIGIKVAWTLSYEAGFYLIAALGFLSVKHWGKRTGLIAVSLVAGPLLYFYPRAIYFAIGTMVYVWRDRFRCGWHFAMRPDVWLFLFLFTWNYPTRWGSELTARWLWGQSTVVNGIAVVFGLIAFAGIVEGRGHFSVLLESRIFQFLGKISYSFYLLHTLIMFFLRKMVFNRLELIGLAGIAELVIFSTISMIISLIVAYWSFVMFESKLRDFIRSRIGHSDKSTR